MSKKLFLCMYAWVASLTYSLSVYLLYRSHKATPSSDSDSDYE